MPTIGGIKNAFKWGDEWNVKAVQFYLTLSRRWDVSDITDGEVEAFKEAWNNSGVEEVVAHIPYLVNLISDNNRTRKKSISRMILEIERAKILGVNILVLHPGSSAYPDKIARLKDSFDEVLTETDPGEVKIMIETMAGQGNVLGRNFDELAEILSVLRKDLFGVCFDSAHVFESGYDLKNNYEDVFEDFSELISLEKIGTFHLNDSRTSFNSKKDRHEEIGKGELGLDFFKKIMNDERFKNIPKIIETPKMGERSLHNLNLLRSLIG